MSLRNKRNNNKGSSNVVNNPSPFFFGRVADSILTSDHPEYKGEDSIGVIFFSKTKNDNITADSSTALDVALPAFPFISSVPLKSEIVQIFPGPSSKIYRKLKGERSNKAYYYYPALNVHNNAEHNALPSDRSTNRPKNNSEEAALGIQQNNTVVTKTTGTVNLANVQVIDKSETNNGDGTFTVSITLEFDGVQVTGIGTSPRSSIAETKARINAEKQFIPEENKTTTVSTSQTSNSNEEDYTDLGDFKDKGLKKKQKFSGDVMIEGRFGQSLRFGSSNPRGRNNWSDNESEGEPIVILGNGSAEETEGDASLEDINNMHSSMWMLSGQNVSNLSVSSDNLQTLDIEFEEPTEEQVLIVDTPTPITVVQPPIIELDEEIVIADDGALSEPPNVVEEAVFDPPLVDQNKDGIFALIDEAVEEGSVTELTSEIFYIAACEPAEEDNTNPSYTNTGNTNSFPVGSRENPHPRFSTKTEYVGLKDRWNSGETVIAYNYKGNSLQIKQPTKVTPSPNVSPNKTIKYLWIHTTAQYDSANPVDIIQTHFLPGNDPDPDNRKLPWNTGGYNITIPRHFGPDLAVRFYNDGVVTNGAGGPLSIADLQLRPLYEISKKTNRNAVNISWIGGTTKKIDIQKNQAYTLRKLIERYVKKYPNILIGGHNQMGRLPKIDKDTGESIPKDTACPVFFVPKYLELLVKDGIVKEKNIYRGGIFGKKEGSAPNGIKGGIDYLQNAQIVYNLGKGK
jgi:hypothetical protein